MLWRRLRSGSRLGGYVQYHAIYRYIHPIYTTDVGSVWAVLTYTLEPVDRELGLL